MNTKSRRAQDAAYVKAYEEWEETGFGGLPMAKRIEMRALGIHEAKLEPRGPAAAGRRGESEFDDPADRAVDLRDPTTELDEPIEYSDLTKICDAFGAALIWAGQAKSLVEMGWRLTTMLQVMRPALVEGMALEMKIELARELVRAMQADRGLIARVGEHYRKVLHWCRRCGSLSQLGARGFAMIYLIKPTAINGRTNAALGELNNRSRQAVNKTVQDARDSLKGFRNEMMRSEETRIKCKRAQTLRS